MSGKKDDQRSQRSSALADKKRRLDELKARRSNRQLQQQQQEEVGASSTSISSIPEDLESVSSSLPSAAAAAAAAVSASRTGNLDEYIDGLLNSTLPIGAPIYNTSSSTAAASNPTRSTSATIPIAKAVPLQSSEASSSPLETKYPEASVEATIVQQPKVETFEICTQTEDDDFPIEISNDDNDSMQREMSEENKDVNEKDGKGQTQDYKISQEEANVIEPKLLNEVEVNATISSNEFTTFFNSASKKVERLLGSKILSDLLVDDMMYYTDLQSKRNDTSRSGLEKSSHSLILNQVLFEYPKWTTGRDITSIDWSVHHRGEVMLASYHMRNSSMSSSSIGSTAISSVGPNFTPSSSLLPTSRSEMIHADGLTIVWNLTMPNRPEHILTCGSPILQSRFHPTEGNLVVGACYSGQVVVWDVRSGRLPVQRSSLNLLGDNAGGHVHPVIGMEVLDGVSYHFLLMSLFLFSSTLLVY